MIGQNLELLSFSPARASWGRVLAFAWVHPEILKDLRQDPQQTITALANPTSDGKYKDSQIDIDEDTKNAADIIKTQTDEDPGEAYRGYLPIPDPLEGLEDLSKPELAGLLENGITGILKFDDQADLWADELLAAWKDREQLLNIRKAPLEYLIHKDQLPTTAYGTLPIPDCPEILQGKSIDELSEFLGGKNMSHLGGIFLLGS